MVNAVEMYRASILVLAFLLLGACKSSLPEPKASQAPPPRAAPSAQSHDASHVDSEVAAYGGVVDAGRPLADVDVNVARTRAERWLDALGKKEWIASFKEESSNEGFIGLRHHNQPQACPHDAADSQFIYYPSSNTRLVSVGFKLPVGPTTSLALAQSALSYVAVDTLPMEGLVAPGWSVFPQTPMSGLREGVAILAFGGGRIGIRVKTKFFAISGTKLSKDCVPLPDSSARPHCYFEVRRDFVGDISIDLPVFSKAPAAPNNQ